MPGACQSREAACPQAGESTFPHQRKILSTTVGRIFLFLLSLLLRIPAQGAAACIRFVPSVKIRSREGSPLKAKSRVIVLS